MSTFKVGDKVFTGKTLYFNGTVEHVGSKGSLRVSFVLTHNGKSKTRSMSLNASKVVKI